MQDEEHRQTLTNDITSIPPLKLNNKLAVIGGHLAGYPYK
jgi:hypothetical protein